jgi:hypothetical protein
MTHRRAVTQRDDAGTSGVTKHRKRRITTRDVDRYIPADAGRDAEREQVKEFLALHPMFRKDHPDEVLNPINLKPIFLGGRAGGYVQPLTEVEVADQRATDTILTQDRGYWQEILASLGFDDEEVSFLIANKLDRVSQCDIHRRLPNWSTATTERVRKSIAVKVKSLEASSIEVERVGGNSLVLAYQDRLPGGGWMHSLADVVLSPEFEDEMSRTLTKYRPITYLPASPHLRHLDRSTRLKLNIEELDKQISAERRKLDTLVKKAREADEELIRAKSHLEALQLKSKTQLEEFITDSARKLDPKLPQQIEATAQRIVDANASVAAYKNVVANQQRVVDELETERNTRHHEAFRLEFVEPAQAAIRELNRIAPQFAELNQIAAKHGVPMTAGDLFPDLIGELNLFGTDIDVSLRQAREKQLQATRALILLGYAIPEMTEKGWTAAHE